MGYLDTLSSVAIANAKILATTCRNHGITNPVAIAGGLAVVSKESGFIPKFETGYSNTSVARIRKIFTTTLKNFSDAQIVALKQDDVKFFNVIYGGRYGNGPDEGYKYRGGGLNQVTFKNNYKKMTQLTGHDLINYPENINQIHIACECMVQYFKSNFVNSASIVKARYGANHINDFSSLETSAMAFYNANAGFGKDTRGSKMDGYARALERVDELYSLIHL